MAPRWTGLVALLALALLPSCDSGGAAETCAADEEPYPGCSFADCQAGRNACGGTVYACDPTGRVVELGTCDRDVPDAAPGIDAEEFPDARPVIDTGPPMCVPGSDPIPECSFSACQRGENGCNGDVFECSASGHVERVGVCHPPLPIDAGPDDGGTDADLAEPDGAPDAM